MNRWITLKNALLTLIIVAVSATTAVAQVEQPSQISVQGTGLVTRNSNDQTPSHEATRSGGLLVGYSYQFSRWFGAEGNYGYTRNTQNYLTLGGPSSLQTNVHEVTGTFVAHIPVNLQTFRPYVLGGGGALIFDPTNKFIVTGAERQTRGAFVYGGGATFGITSNLGLRVEYRGLMYKVPDFTLENFNLDKFTHLSQPSIGFVVRF
jgi:opacity protein-like surface antigen